MKLYDAYGRLVCRSAGFGASLHFRPDTGKDGDGDLCDAIGYEVPDESETEESYDDNDEQER